MGFKEFIKFDLQKLILLIFLVLFGPLPFFVMTAVGFAPPILFLLELTRLNTYTDSNIILFIMLPMFLISTLVAYLISCTVALLIKKISPEKRTQWIMIAIFLALLVLFALFFPIYSGQSETNYEAFNYLNLIKPYF